MNLLLDSGNNFLELVCTWISNIVEGIELTNIRCCPYLQVLSMSEELRRALYANSAISLDVDIIPPDLVGTTEILSDEHRENLCRHLPARAEGYLWTLVFSTSQHGFSLNSMYRKMAKVESPILLVIEDTAKNVRCILHHSIPFETLSLELSVGFVTLCNKIESYFFF